MLEAENKRLEQELKAALCELETIKRQMSVLEQDVDTLETELIKRG